MLQTNELILLPVHVYLKSFMRLLYQYLFHDTLKYQISSDSSVCIVFHLLKTVSEKTPLTSLTFLEMYRKINVFDV